PDCMSIVALAVKPCLLCGWKLQAETAASEHGRFLAVFSSATSYTARPANDQLTNERRGGKSRPPKAAMRLRAGVDMQPRLRSLGHPTGTSGRIAVRLERERSGRRSMLP